MAMMDMSVDKETEKVGTQLENNISSLNEVIKNLESYTEFVSENWQYGGSANYLKATNNYITELKKIYDELQIEQKVISKIFSAYKKLDDDISTDFAIEK